METVTITIPGSGLLVGELAEYRELVASFSDLIDQVDEAFPRRVPRRMTRTLVRHQEALAELSGLRLTTAIVRLG